MRFFCVLLAWLVMAAIPLQGLAAASMLYCGMGAHHDAQAESAATAQHDHSQHAHGVDGKASKGAGNVQQKLPDAAHKCGVCASCCHSVAITELPQTAVFAPLPQVQWAEPFVLLHARPAVVPDRPPRA